MLVLLIILGFLGYKLYSIYQTLPINPKELIIENASNGYDTGNVIADQFASNMRFNHNSITYFIASDCDGIKRDKMLEAFSILEEETEIISFFEDGEDADIIIACSDIEIQKDENLFIAGEGGPSKYINNTIYPLILKGRIFLYRSGDCIAPLVEMHELLHVFGFDHSEDKTDIMYPNSDCSQALKQKYIQSLKELYSIPAKADLYFKDSNNLVKAGSYLNFEVTVVNQGIIDAKTVSLTAYADNKQLESFDLKDIKVGEGQKFSVQNLKLPSPNSKGIELRISSPTQEYDLGNNILRAA